jgi:hypothetical protein
MVSKERQRQKYGARWPDQGNGHAQDREKSPKILTAMLTVILLSTSCQVLNGYQTTSSAPAGQSSGGTEGSALSASDQSLVAPVALYPDSLVAQILTASTFLD